MISNKHLVELIIFFVAFPVFLAVPEITVLDKLIVSIIPLVFVVQKSIYYHKSLFKKTKQVKPIKFWKKVGYRSFIIFTATYIYIRHNDPDLLFISITTQPWLWIKMMILYTFLSVIPQEYVYRVFFFYRYRKLTYSAQHFYLINAFLFSIAHLMFHNWLVMIMTFIGGYIFAFTYSKTKSWFWVSVEHTIYGGWLFTVGYGKILGFPI
ncbi:CPBP family intramembrane glutamic endopeptidase [Ochrovirga pacifica]|uniref:CPBP family intramembrane glutamic endopeptidase n=1 Tax=Ochrovirga pacifica TaxID=1042376 RepID=UPI0002559DAC|nr:CPBP family intramembrane glutamic endopeptidase [Ochrovirga pacifica]